MAIKKPTGRNSDRVRIRKMWAQGYAVSQIANAVSIVEEYIEYVINEYDADKESAKYQERQEKKEREALVTAAVIPESAPRPEGTRTDAQDLEEQPEVEEEAPPKRTRKRKTA